jgi:peptidoglycan/LPS O-acetylase OafA/YrhL
MPASPSATDTLPASPALAPRHNPALDGIRFFAFLAVFGAHAGTLAAFGAYGVRVFFVLSGFLIGRILLNLRKQDLSLGQKLKTFYIRRSLRIFPLYYLVLTLVWLLPHLGVRCFGISKAIAWQYLYLNNFYQLFVAMPGSSGHFWSLAIEEQFYLISPVIILALPLASVRWGILALWILNAGLYIANGLVWHWGLMFLLPNIQFGFISMGIAAAYVQVHGNFMGVGRRGVLAVGVVTAAIVIALLYPLKKELIDSRFFDLFEWALCFCSATVCLGLWSGKLGLLQRFLSTQPLPYLGRISYGLYVYHSFILYAAIHSWGGREKDKILALALTLVVSVLSWHLFEKPLNDLKRFSPYRPASKPG